MGLIVDGFGSRVEKGWTCLAMQEGPWGIWRKQRIQHEDDDEEKEEIL